MNERKSESRNPFTDFANPLDGTAPQTTVMGHIYSNSSAEQDERPFNPEDILAAEYGVPPELNEMNSRLDAMEASARPSHRSWVLNGSEWVVDETPATPTEYQVDMSMAVGLEVETEQEEGIPVTGTVFDLEQQVDEPASAFESGTQSASQTGRGR